MNYLRRFIPPLTILALALLGLQAILQPSLPCTDDAAFHLFRLTQLDHMLQQGIIYSRWAPDMAYGYGYPFFNFYAPLSTYAAELISLLTRNLNLALRVSFALSFYFSGVTAYLFARDQLSKLGALVTAVSFMYAPYLAYDILFRGNLAETMAWPLLPLALWGMGRLARTGGRRYFLLTTLSYAAILLMHNVFALIFSPLLGLYGIVNLSLLQTEQSNRNMVLMKRFIIISTALLFGLGITTFFWLPALIERAMVHSDRLLIPPTFVYWGNFVTLYEIFTPPPVVYSDLLNPSPERALGLIPLLLALPAIFLGWNKKWTKFPLLTLFFANATAVYTVLMLSISTPVWANLPLIEFVQFPWRMLGPAALTLAMLVGISIDLMPRSPAPLFRFFAALTFIALLIRADLYFLDARYCPGLASPTIADMYAFEHGVRVVGTTAKGEYLPLTVEEMPSEQAVEQFVPSAAAVSITNHHPLHLEAAVTAGEPFTLTANTFDYAGWRAKVDGDPVPITPTDRYGLISLPVPAGTHRVNIDFGSTPLRTTAVILSIITALILLFITVKLPLSPAHFVPSPLSWKKYGAAALIGAAALFVAPYMARERLPDLGNKAVFANQMYLRDYIVDRRSMPSNGSLAVRAFWQAKEAQTRNFRDTLRLVDENGMEWSPNTSNYPRRFRPPQSTTRWPANMYADILHGVTAFPASPPGLYQINLILFDEESLETVPLENGERALNLGTILLERPTEMATIEPQFEMNARWGAVSLVGYNLDRQEAAPGDPFLLTTFWQMDGETDDDLIAHLSLVDENGDTAFTRSFTPVRSDFPTSEWQDGDLWRGQELFRLPVALESGVYEWQLCLINDEDEDCRMEPLNTLTINAPNRVFTLDSGAFDTRAVAAFGKSPTSDRIAQLEGVTMVEMDEGMEITAVWHAITQTDISYRVFVHLLDEDGTLIAQSDGEPVHWTRPTTGWMAGEFISDTHQLNGRGAKVLIGLYDPETGERLVLDDGETAVELIDHGKWIIGHGSKN